jgi:HEAT repeat protein
MLEPHSPNPAALRLPPFPSSANRGVVQAAKWPPDDADLPGGGGAGGGIPAGGGGFDGGDPDFKKGRFGLIGIAVAVVVVAVGIAFAVLGVKQDEQKIGVEEAAQLEKTILVMPVSDQLAEWRKWAQSNRSSELRQEALKRLAWAQDPAGVDYAVQSLSHVEDPVRAMAATALAEYGSPLADKAKPALVEALKKATSADKPQIAWALVELGDATALQDILALYRAGHLSKVQRLDGVVAFDPMKIVRLMSLDDLAKYAGDQSPAVRQLVATVLSRKADARFTEPLIQLLGDADKEVSRQAAPGLGKIGDERAREPLLKALRGADKESRGKYLEALRDGIGTKGLVLALDSVSQDDPERAWFQTKQIFDLIEGSKESNTHGLNDPRGGDTLAQYIDKKPHIHWQTRAAIALAKIGDLRAVPTLARRLRMDPLKIYSDDTDQEMLLKRDDNERVVASRMIADLAVLHKDKAEQIRNEAEDAVIFWLHELPSPHANGLRALAAMGSTKDIEALRKWANPSAPLPKQGQQPPMPEEWVIAQSALRYVGWLKDENSWTVLTDMLKKRPHDIDATMDSLLQGGLAILGMTLRAVGVGAADGLSEWGDPKAFPLLLDYIEDSKNNEQSRMSACAALAWVAKPEDMITVAKKIQEYSKPDKKSQTIRSCLLETLVTRPVPGTAGALLTLLTPDQELDTRHQISRAIGKAGLTPDVEAKLFEMQKNEQLLTDATLALVLGGAPETAARAIAYYGNKDEKSRKPALDEFQDLYFRTFGYWSTEDLEKGRIFRWVDGAVAISRVEIAMTPQEWARVLLEKQFDNLHFDNGPHSFTRVVLRSRLMDMAKGTDEAARAGAIRTLKFMKEQGVLLALRDEPGKTGELAAEAYHDLMNPKVVTDVKIPESGKAE